MTSVQTFYTCNDFQNIMFDKNPTLSSHVLSILKYIEESIVIPTELPEPTVSIRRHDNGMLDRQMDRSLTGSIGRPRRSNGSSKQGTRKPIRDNDPIDTHGIVFKSKSVEPKQGIEWDINSVRILLNKISTKTYHEQKTAIVDRVLEILNSSSISDNHRVIQTVFDIISSNVFLSELYADLYVELMKRTLVFEHELIGFVERYQHSLKQIYYVDPNVDYDGFCQYNKINDMRKSMATFIVNLMKRGKILQQEVLQIITEFMEVTITYIDMENKTNEVDEITENIALLITESKPILSTTDVWINTIGPNIKKISTMKAKDHPSLSSRVIFKYMDL
jgi:hypothetical protein